MADEFLPTGNPEGRPVAVVVGATSKWQADGDNTRLEHGTELNDDAFPSSSRWGLGGALAHRFADDGFHVVLTSRSLANLHSLSSSIEEGAGHCSSVRLDVTSPDSVREAFASIRSHLGIPEVLIYNAGYMAGRELSDDYALLEDFPTDLFDTALAIAGRGPFLVAKEVLPGMRRRGNGSFFFSNNQYSLRGRKRLTGQSLYYPRGMMRALAQALVEEYSTFGVHVANIIVDGYIDSPGTRALVHFEERPDELIDPSAIADTFIHLHRQHPSCWTHEIQLTSSQTPVSY